MILLDSNVLIYADDPNSPFHLWAKELIIAWAGVEEAAVNPVIVAELCVGETNPSAIPARIQSWGILFADLPTSVSLVCARAYRLYRGRRNADSGKPSSVVPLPDFFIGAHAMVMGWDIATADRSRFSTYFPTVKLITPPEQLL